MASAVSTGSRNPFARFAAGVDRMFAKSFYSIGLFVGSRPLLSIAASFFVMLVCCGGFSQLNAEDRSDKLWIPQNTQAQKDEAQYTSHFPPASRLTMLLLESKSSNVLDKASLQAAMKLHYEIEALSSTVDGTTDDLRSLCILQAGRGHPCFVNSVLEIWEYNKTTLDADADPMATINAAKKSRSDLERMLGGAAFNGAGQLTGASVMTVTYFMQLNREQVGGSYEDKRGEAWEEVLLEHLKCDDPTCSDDECSCGYDSSSFHVFATATRSWSDAFGGVIRGDVGLINGAFIIMILYLVLNLGGLCHKVNSRALLAFACTISIVAAGAAGYGLSMYCQFDYTPIHGVLPFVILGIGVDDSFVIMNAFDRTDPSKPVAERIADALSHAGVSVFVTSLTDFVAFLISVSSALPALSSFCFYAAMCVFFLFTFQITMFTALAALDARRVEANRIDCCFCLPQGCPCCPTVDKEQAATSIESGQKDPNQLGSCRPQTHKGGNIGKLLEKRLAPILVTKPATFTIIVFFVGLCAIFIWQATLLSVEDTQRKFIPDDSYVLSTINKNDAYFGAMGTRFNIMTVAGDYFGSQGALVDIGSRIAKIDSVVPPSGDSFSSWAVSFKEACAAGSVGMTVTTNSDGFVTESSQYYTALSSWLQGAGARFAGEVKWVDSADPQKGIVATRFSAELKSVNVQVGDRVLPDADFAVKAMDAIRSACDSWSDMPGGKAIAYSSRFLTWETFKVIAEQMYVSVGQCLAAVLVITILTIGQPLTAGLVFVCVLMTVVDILGCMQLWGLAIDSVSVIQLVIAVGLSVDYAAHIGHNFMTQTGSRSERITKTLGDVGSAVLCGGTSTFLGVLLLALSQSYVFRVLFQTFFLTVTLGLAHGLLFLPALLNLVGPESYQSGACEVRVTGKQ